MYRRMCWAILLAKRNFIENERKNTADAPILEVGHPNDNGGKVNFSNHGLIFVNMQIQ